MFALDGFAGGGNQCGIVFSNVVFKCISSLLICFVCFFCCMYLCLLCRYVVVVSTFNHKKETTKHNTLGVPSSAFCECDTKKKFEKNGRISDLVGLGCQPANKSHKIAQKNKGTNNQQKKPAQTSRETNKTKQQPPKSTKKPRKTNKEI